MKKFLIALISVVVVGYIGSPLVIGLVAREEFPATIKAMGNGQYPWTADKFDLGYIHSSAESTLTVPIAGHHPLIVHLHHKITQRLGADLSVMKVITTATVDGDYKAKVAAVFGAKSPMMSQTIIYLDGHYAATMDMPAIADTAIPGKAGVHVSFRGLHGTESGILRPHTSIAHLTMPAFTLTSDKDGVTFNMKDVKLDSNTKMTDRWLQVGNAVLSVKQITISPKALPPTRLGGFVIKAESHQEGGDIGLDYDIRMADFDSPALKYKNLAVQLVASHLDAQVFRSLAKRITDINRGTSDPKQMLMMYRATFRQIAPELLAHSPRLDIKRIAFDLPGGHVQLKGSADFDGNGFTGSVSPASLSRVSATATIDAAQGAYQRILHTFMWPRALAYLKVHKPKLSPMQRYALGNKLAETMATQTTQRLLQHRLILATADGYTSHLSYHKGAMSVNGEALGAMPMR